MILRILVLFLFTQYLFAQEKSIVYVNDSTAYYSKSEIERINEPTFCDITINPNSTFSFYSRPHVSCFTWKEIKGKWKKKNNIYTFLSQYEITENDTKFTFKKDSVERYLLTFRTDKNSELKNRTVKINYIYDFDAKINGIEKTVNLDLKNSIILPFFEIPNIDKLASIKIEYQLSSKEKRYGYITENKTVNVKEKEIPNLIEIEFIEFPKKEIVYRTTKGKIDNDKLEIISSTKTKTTLPDYTKEIGFEKYYELVK